MYKFQIMPILRPKFDVDKKNSRFENNNKPNQILENYIYKTNKVKANYKISCRS